MRRSLVLAGCLAVVVTGARLYIALNGAPMPEPEPQSIERLDKPKSEWRQILAAEEYAVMFEEATERPWSSPLNEETRTGTYVCAACGLPLFKSGTKYESGTGWPSFWQSIEGHIGTRKDFSLIIPRTEYHCIRCGAHQGHVFRDGPRPTGLRYCNNGIALHFVPEGTPLPPLRE